MSRSKKGCYLRILLVIQLSRIMNNRKSLNYRMKFTDRVLCLIWVTRVTHTVGPTDSSINPINKSSRQARHGAEECLLIQLILFDWFHNFLLSNPSQLSLCAAHLFAVAPAATVKEWLPGHIPCFYILRHMMSSLASTWSRLRDRRRIIPMEVSRN